MEWKPVVNYERLYEVSSSGLVRRSDGYHKEPKTLRPSTNHHGYKCVSLSKSGKCKTFFVHKLVSEAFHGLRPAGLTINHKNGIKADNSEKNLEYLTHVQNMHHANFVINTLTPTRARGPKNGSIARPERLARGISVASAKLDDSKVKIVRGLLSQGIKQRDIAKAVGISQTQIWRINHRISWAHVE